MYDIIIKNGTVIDGTGARMFRADVGVKEDRIRSIGDLGNEAADRFIDARDCYVAPGFIDVNNHSDTYWQLFLNPGLESLLYQGVTTVVGGNCGTSLAPLADQSLLQSLQKWADIRKANLNWLSMEEFLEELARHRPAVNFATLVGHGTLRRGLIRDEARNLLREEVAAELKMLERSLGEGAFGLSSGLAYAHIRRASREELRLLAETVRKYGGVYAFHLRGESSDLLKSIEEAVLAAKSAGAKLHISHLKAVGEEAWPLMDGALGLVDSARAQGLDVTFDVYPYTHTGSVLYTLLPEWVTEGGRKMMIERLKDPGLRHEAVRELREKKWDFGKAVLLNSSLNQMVVRQNILEMSRAQDKSPEELLVDILVASNGRATASLEVISEENVEKALAHPAAVVSTNGSGYSVDYAETGERVHPRSFGSFVRVLERYVRERQTLGWEEAVHKMSGKPAEKFGLKKRGTLRRGNYADIAVFRPDELSAPATMDDPYRYSRGMRWVLVNGEVEVDRGDVTGKRSGEILKRKRSWFG
jgi:N-acyl-D-amino-acid deacylase